MYILYISVSRTWTHNPSNVVPRLFLRAKMLRSSAADAYSSQNTRSGRNHEHGPN